MEIFGREIGTSEKPTISLDHVDEVVFKHKGNTFVVSLAEFREFGKLSVQANKNKIYVT